MIKEVYGHIGLSAKVRAIEQAEAARTAWGTHKTLHNRRTARMRLFSEFLGSAAFLWN